MIPLRQLFLSNFLIKAARKKRPTELKVIREVIKRIKEIQLEKLRIADDDMVRDVLKSLIKEKEDELKIIKGFANDAGINKRRFLIFKF